MYFKIFFFICFLKYVKADFIDTNFDSDFYNDLSEFACQDNFCNINDLIGPPPDMILNIPPPPIPSFFKDFDVLKGSESNLNEQKCNFCGFFNDQNGLGFTLPKQLNHHKIIFNSLFLYVSLITTSTFLMLFIYLKFKKLKISLVDTCSSFSHNLFSKSKDLQVDSRIDNCISPVVNEKSPQSIITNSPSKKSTIIPAKYWKTPSGNGISFNNVGNHLMGNEFNSNLMDNTLTTDMGEYLACQDVGSCTSSPVYAELDPNNQQIGLDNMSNLITLNNLNNLNPMIMNNQPVRYKSYTMRTYSEIPDPSKMITIPDVSYDNEAYLPSSNSDYHNKSLIKNRQSTLNKLGSKAPLLGSHCSNGTNSNHAMTLSYLINEKNIKKSKQAFIQNQLANRMSMNNSSLIKNQETDASTMQPRYVQGNAKNIIHEIYNGQQILTNSPSISTFRASYAFNKDQPKRPLPPVPGVRL